MAPQQVAAPARPPSTARDGVGSLVDGRRRGTPPQALWHPIPLTGIAFVVGGVDLAIGIVRGGSASGSLAVGSGRLIITLAAMELCAREHLAGRTFGRSSILARPAGGSARQRRRTRSTS